jgi:hypothetical protein
MSRKGRTALLTGGLLLAPTGCGTSSSGPGAAAGMSSPSGSAGSGSASGSSGGAGSGGGAATGSTTGAGGAGNVSGGSGVVTGSGSTSGAGGAGSGSASGVPTAGSGLASSAAGAGSGSASAGVTSASGSVGSGRVPVDGGSAFNGPVFYLTNNDGTLYAFQEGSWTTPIGMWAGLPILDSARGSDVDPRTGILYLTHGGAGPNSKGAPNLNGSLLAWSLLTNSVVFDVHFTHGVDQPSVGNGVVFVPSGEYTNDRNWYYESSATGVEGGNEMGGMNPHDTIFKNGHRYYGGTQDTYLYVLGLPTANAVTKVGPSPSTTAGVRPFTVNAAETRVYITWSNYRGFSVGDLTTGKLLSSLNFGPNTCMLAAPSHGMSLSPDGTEVYVLDTCVGQVRVYDSSDAPQLKATITMAHPISGAEVPCVWDCNRDGWIMHSRDGKYLYIGDSGDVIDTATRMPTGYIAPLQNCRHGFVEVDWTNGVITGTTTHVGLGY